MKGKNLMLLALIGMLSLTVIQESFGSVQTSAISTSVNETREYWADNTEHFRRQVLVDGNGYHRGKGMAVEYSTGLNLLPGLDVNSIRLYKDGVEIPSEYVANTGKLIFVVSGEVSSSKLVQYWIYYDLVVNGLKEWPDYDPGWIADIKDQIDNADDSDEGEAYSKRDEYVEENGIVWDDELDEYTYRNQIVYFDAVAGKWRYQDGTELDPGFVVWDDVDGCWKYWDGTRYKYYYTPGLDEEIFVSARYDAMLDGIMGNDANYDSWSVGNVKGTGTGHYDYYSPSHGHWVTEELTATAYNGGSTMFFNAKSGVATSEEASASALLDLNGTVLFNGTYIDNQNIDEYLDENVPEHEEGFAEYQEHRTAADRFQIVTADNDFSIDDIAWNDAYIMGSSSVDTYDRGTKREKKCSFGSGITNYDLDFSDVLSIEKVIGSISGLLSITDYTLFEGTPDEIQFSGNPLTDGEEFTIYYKNKRYSGDDILKVFPVLLESNYIALYDELSDLGFGWLFQEEMAFDHVLIEAWKEVKGGQTRYYVNITVNALDWWFDRLTPGPGAPGPLRMAQSGTFDFIFTYIDSEDVTSFMLGLGYKSPKHKVIKIKDEDSLPLKIKIKSPQNGQHYGSSSKITINFIVEGETLASTYIRINGKSPIKITTNIDYFWTEYDGIHSLANLAMQGSVDHNVTNSGTLNLTIQAEDTNGSIIEEDIVVYVDDYTIAIVLAISIPAVAICGTFLYLRAKRPDILDRIKGTFKGKRSVKTFKL